VTESRKPQHSSPPLGSILKEARDKPLIVVGSGGGGGGLNVSTVNVRLNCGSPVSFQVPFLPLHNDTTLSFYHKST
jgi:hypothetical protein